MDDQILQRLMIDEALGALTPDVQALLTDFLHNRTQSTELQRWRSLARAAQEAMGETTVERPPALRLHPQPLLPLKRFSFAALAMAAMVLIAVCIRLGSPAQSPLGQQVALVQPVPAQAPASPGATGFWSSRRFLAAMQSQPARPGVTWTWSDLRSSKGNLQ